MKWTCGLFLFSLFFFFGSLSVAVLGLNIWVSLRILIENLTFCTPIDYCYLIKSMMFDIYHNIYAEIYVPMKSY